MDDSTYGKPQVWTASDPPPPQQVLPVQVEVEQVAPSTDNDKSDDGSWFSRNTIDAIIVIVLSVFNLITIILLATSYRTFRTVKRHLKQQVRSSSPVGRFNRRAAERLGIAEVFDSKNMCRLHRLGDMPSIPPFLHPRFRFRRARKMY